MKYDLKKTSKLMREQGNRGTQYPLFVVQTLEREYGDQYGDGRERSPHYEIEDLCEKCQEQEELGKPLDDYCYECSSSLFSGYEDRWEIQDRGSFFFTEEACEDHIASNLHHYNKPRSYVISAWRNPEVVAIMQSILLLTGDDIPSCYS